MFEGSVCTLELFQSTFQFPNKLSSLCSKSKVGSDQSWTLSETKSEQILNTITAQWADKGGQRILVCFHAFSLFFFDKNVTIMSRIDIIIHYSSFENLFTKEKSHF